MYVRLTAFEFSRTLPRAREPRLAPLRCAAPAPFPCTALLSGFESLSSVENNLHCMATLPSCKGARVRHVGVHFYIVDDDVAVAKVAVEPKSFEALAREHGKLDHGASGLGDCA